MTGGVHIASEPVRSEVEAAGPAGRPVPTRERLLVGAASALFLHLVLFRGVTPIFPFAAGSNGVFFDEGLRILNGEVMYRDFFEFLTPGTPYVNAAVIALFGPRIAAFGYLSVVIGATLAWLLHRLSARAVGPGYRLIPAVAFVVLVYAPFGLGNHKWPALAAGFGGLLLLLRSTSASASILSGALFGLSAVFTLDFGVGMTAGAVLYLLTDAVQGRRRAAAVVLGCLLSTGLAMSYFVAKAGLFTVIYDCLVFPLTRYRNENQFRVDLFDHLGPRTQAQLALCAAGIVSGVFFALVKRETDETTRLLSFVGLGLIVATVHRPVTPAVAAIRCAPLLIPLARGMELLGRSRPGPLRWGNLGLLTVLATGVTWGTVSLIAQRQWMDPLTRETHRAGEVWVRSPLREVSWIETQTREGDAVFLLPIKGGLHFLSRTRSAVSIPYVMGSKNTLEHIHRVVGEIETKRPAVGVWQKTSDLPELYQAITKHYEAVGTAPDRNILFRRRPRSLGSDLTEGRARID